jgi:hypothetical protein
MGNGTPQQPDGGGLATFATIVFMGLIILLVAVVCYRILTAPGLPEGSRSWLEYGNFFYRGPRHPGRAPGVPGHHAL